MSETVHENYDRDRLDALYFEPPYVPWEEQEEEEQPDPPCRECGAPTDDGEGWDGLCGNCADRAEADDAACQGHESLDGPIGHVSFCDGSCAEGH